MDADTLNMGLDTFYMRVTMYVLSRLRSFFISFLAFSLTNSIPEKAKNAYTPGITVEQNVPYANDHRLSSLSNIFLVSKSTKEHTYQGVVLI